MGKKRIEKFQRLTDDNQRKVTFCKRKKGLLKKSIEFSQLCGVSVFLFVYDKQQKRVVHYASNPQDSFLSIFNEQSFREFYTNKDYVKVGGRKEDLDLSGMEPADKKEGNPYRVDNDLEISDEMMQPKIFSRKRIDLQVTSQIGCLNT